MLAKGSRQWRYIAVPEWHEGSVGDSSTSEGYMLKSYEVHCTCTSGGLVFLYLMHSISFLVYVGHSAFIPFIHNDRRIKIGR